MCVVCITYSFPLSKHPAQDSFYTWRHNNEGETLETYSCGLDSNKMKEKTSNGDYFNHEIETVTDSIKADAKKSIITNTILIISKCSTSPSHESMII